MWKCKNNNINIDKSLMDAIIEKTLSPTEDTLKITPASWNLLLTQCAEIIKFIEKQSFIKLNVLHYGALFSKLSSANGNIKEILDFYKVCVDCHEATKYISKVRNRKITVRDQKVFHVFHDGKCSCGDFW